MTAPTHDDHFHEIQLNGKQLVFLFMAATVVSVVIFLSGVMVGRGVRAERLAAAAATDALAEPTADAVTPPPADPPPATIDLTKAEAPPTAGESGSAVDAGKEFEEIRPDRPARKEPTPVPDKKPAQMASAATPAATPAAATAAPAVAKPTASREATAPPAASPATKPAAKTAAKPAAAASTSAPAEGGAFAVQVAALNTRGEADAIAKRLSSKGYAAYVQVPAGTTSVFRVRVGSYKTRREAEAVASKLQKEERVKPWVTR